MSSSSTTPKNSISSFIVYSSDNLSELKLKIYRALSLSGVDLTRFYEFADLAGIVYQTVTGDDGKSYVTATNQTRFELPGEMVDALVKMCPGRIHHKTADGGFTWTDPEETIEFRNKYGFTVGTTKFNRERYNFVAEREFVYDGRRVVNHYRNDALFIRFPTANHARGADWATDQIVLITEEAESVRRRVMKAMNFKSDKTLTHEVTKNGIMVKFAADISMAARALIHHWYSGRVTKVSYGEGADSYYEFNFLRVDWARDFPDRSKSHRNSTSRSRV